MSETQIIQALPDGPATNANVQLTLQGAEYLLGPNGGGWIKNELQNQSGVCLVRALELAAPNYQSYQAAVQAIKTATGDNHIDRWNNAPTTTFQDVSNAISQAGSMFPTSFGERLTAFAGKLAGFFGR